MKTFSFPLNGLPLFLKLGVSWIERKVYHSNTKKIVCLVLISQIKLWSKQRIVFSTVQLSDAWLVITRNLQKIVPQVLRQMIFSHWFGNLILD